MILRTQELFDFLKEIQSICPTISLFSLIQF